MVAIQRNGALHALDRMDGLDGSSDRPLVITTFVSLLDYNIHRDIDPRLFTFANHTH